MSRAALYLRVSTAQQGEDDKTSLDFQRQACADKARALGASFGDQDVYRDTASGATDQRPELQRLLAGLDRYSFVILYDDTRLARDREVASRLRKSFGSRLRFVIGDMPADLDEDEDDVSPIVNGVRDGSSEGERKRLKRRARMGREGKAGRGQPTGRCPIGYLPRYQGESTRRRVLAGFDLDPSTDRFFADLEALFLDGTPYSGLGEALARLGHYRKGRRWTPSALRYILNNPTYQGRLVFRRTGKASFREKYGTITQEGAFPVRWGRPEAVAAELRRRQGTRALPRAEARYRLSGLLTCAGCGWSLVAHPRKHLDREGGERHYTYWVCGRHREFVSKRWHEDCPSPERITDPRAVAEVEHLIGYLAGIDSSGVRALLTPERPDISGAIASARVALAQAERRRDNLVGNLAETEPAAAAPLRRALAEATEEADNLRRSIADLEADQAEVPDTESLAGVTVEDLPDAELRALVRRVFRGGLEIKAGHVFLFGRVVFGYFRRVREGVWTDHDLADHLGNLPERVGVRAFRRLVESLPTEG